MNMVVTHWSANPVVLPVCAAVVVVHLNGMRATAADNGRAGRTPRKGTRTQAVAFYGGLAAVIIALVSPVGYWSGHYIWVRSLQDLLLALVAPGLIVLGAPWLVLARGAGIRLRERPAPDPDLPPRRTERDRQPGPWAPRHRPLLSGPAAVIVAVDVAWWVWHAPLLYDAALRSPLIYGAQVVVYLGLGVAFWLQLAGSWPLEPRLPPLSRVMLIAVTVVSDMVLGIGLIFGSSLMYRGYVTTAHSVTGVIADQQVGGAILWVLALPPLIIAAVALLGQWLKEEESAGLTAGFDRLLKSQVTAWPRRSGLG